jgi:hypothetical protein
MTIDVLKEAARMAALIGEPMPHVVTLPDLLAYADYVGRIVRSRARFDEEAVDDLRRTLDPDGWWREFRMSRERWDRRMNRLKALKTVQSMNVAKRQAQGAETRAKIARLAALYNHLPERSQAAAIARRLEMSARQVRRILKETGRGAPCPPRRL